MGTFLVLCASDRDRRELALLDRYREHEFFFRDYASRDLERMLSPCPGSRQLTDPEEEVAGIVLRYESAGIDGVISTDDYPGSTLASIVAERFRLPGVSPRVNLLCQHKYHARVAQRDAMPEVVPPFGLLGFNGSPRLPYPFFIKPVKSFFSIGAYRIDNAARLRELNGRATLPEHFFAPFDALYEKFAGASFGNDRVLAEGLLEGYQATLEGWAVAGDVHIAGIVDSIMFPGTLAFQRFDYPSRLSQSVQARMADAATVVMQRIGFDHGCFNIEFMYNRDRDSVHIIEINPRMASQFADLFEKVDGFNTYSALLDLALGKRPQMKRADGKYAMAASCVLRRFQNARVLKIPRRDDVEQLQRCHPDMRVEILATENAWLSDELQDRESYRYGVVSIGGRDHQEIAELLECCKRRLPFVFGDH